MTHDRPASAMPPPPSPPWEARCSACGGWLATVPAGTSWVRARCGNRQVGGIPGRKCPLYAQSKTYKRMA